MEGFSFVTCVTGLNRPNTGKEDDDDDDDECLLNHSEAHIIKIPHLFSHFNALGDAEKSFKQ
jgi:hypothetical protein